MTKHRPVTRDTYTIMVGQQPIGMARADHPQEALEFIQRLCQNALDPSELRLRAPTASETVLFEKRCGTMAKDGVLGFVL